ncbi:MAG: hypothetical protein WD490_03290 [Opitutales bacterium]
MAELAPPLTKEDILANLQNPTFSVYLHIGQAGDEGWANAEIVADLLARLRIYLVTDQSIVAEWAGDEDPAGIAFGWGESVFQRLSLDETNDLKTVLNAIRDARKS